MGRSLVANRLVKTGKMKVKGKDVILELYLRGNYKVPYTVWYIALKNWPLLQHMVL